MGGLSSDVVGLIYDLLPGFIVAWLFYALTAHQPKSNTHWFVLAIIYTSVIKALTVTLRGITAAFTQLNYSDVLPGDWQLVVGSALALILGLGISFLANTDYLHSCLRNWNITKRTSFASAWNRVFHQKDDCWIILHLVGSRRLFGFPDEWPDHPDEGHFIIVYPEWLVEDGPNIDLKEVDSLVVPVKDVELVEILHKPKDTIKAVDSAPATKGQTDD